MNIEIRLFRRKVQFVWRRLQKVRGICSDLKYGYHFLLWDFDMLPLDEVEESLRFIQGRFKLPTIHIIQTAAEGGYHAYCFKRVTWPQCLYILSMTEGLDSGYFKIGVLRGYFTLRITPKIRRNGKAEGFTQVMRLPSHYRPDVSPDKATNLVEYWTKRS